MASGSRSGRRNHAAGTAPNRRRKGPSTGAASAASAVAKNGARRIPCASATARVMKKASSGNQPEWFCAKTTLPSRGTCSRPSTSNLK